MPFNPLHLLPELTDSPKEPSHPPVKGAEDEPQPLRSPVAKPHSKNDSELFFYLPILLLIFSALALLLLNQTRLL